MKDIIKKVLIIIIGIILIILCRIDFKTNKPNDNIKVQSFNCNLTNETDEYKLESIYTVQYKEDVITMVLFYEEIDSDDKDVITDLYEEKSNKYKNFNNSYGGLLYNIGKGSKRLTFEVSIDYTKVNMNALLENDSTLKNYVNDKNQLTVNGIKEYYYSLGIVCE